MNPIRQLSMILILVALSVFSVQISVGSNVVFKNSARPDLRSPHTTSDTTRPQPAVKQSNPTARQAAGPMILPGTRLDPRFRHLPAQDSTVAKAAPAWLRAKLKGTPLYIIDGYGATAAQIRRLQQKQVASVQVLDGAKAAKLYGSNARAGMVIITTKAAL